MFYNKKDKERVYKVKIIDRLQEDKITLSFEVFPPKYSKNYDAVSQKALEIAKLHPDFMSVTYGAGGGTSEYTVNIAKEIQQREGVDVLAHLTCVSSTKEKVHNMLEIFKANGIENIMALRGDLPDGEIPHHYEHASELIKEIKAFDPNFCIGGACYPEGHPEAHNKNEDIENLKKKIDAGCDFLTSQMFFDNAIFYNFLFRAREAGIQVPIVAGIMPITRKEQVKRAIQLSGSSVPARFVSMVDAFGDNEPAMKQAGIIYATEQITDLIANGVKHIHVYTMNKPDVAKGIMDNLSEILK